ncbi:MAG: hypothetical protein DSZ12_00105 [Sulfurovum sp.]|nr:MAG: hypothetical protein DSZ12_00105 [Sulfurovum sp.]
MEIQTGNFAVSYLIGTQKPDIQMQTFQNWDLKKKNMLLFSSEKNENHLDIYKNTILKLGKIQIELNFLFGVYY